MSSLEGVDRMFSVAAPQVRGKSAQDNIFAANNRNHRRREWWGAYFLVHCF